MKYSDHDLNLLCTHTPHKRSCARRVCILRQTGHLLGIFFCKSTHKRSCARRVCILRQTGHLLGISLFTTQKHCLTIICVPKMSKRYCYLADD